MASGRFQKKVDEASRAVGRSALRIGQPLAGGTKAESNQRLQIGLFGLGSMVLLIGLATIIGNQADLTQESSVPQAAPTTEPTEAATQRDPLADAGIVPLPVEAPDEAQGASVVEDLPDSAMDGAGASEPENTPNP